MFEFFASADPITIASLIVAVLSVLVAIAIPLLGVWYGRRRVIRKNFVVVWRLSRWLNFKDIWSLRSANQYYWKREIDHNLQVSLSSHQNTLVIGRPISGKTRAVFEVIRQGWWAVTILRCSHIKLDTFEFPRRFKWCICLTPILIIDDLQRFIEQENYDHVLREAVTRNVLLIATCRSGVEHTRGMTPIRVKKGHIS